MSESDSERRRRLINLGEIIALAALIVSAVGVWIAWKSSSEDKLIRVVEQPRPIPLALRGKSESDGRSLEITPVESAHGLESLTVSIAGSAPIQIGSDGELNASDVEAALKGRDKEPKDKTLSVPVRISAHYVEAGVERTGGGRYTLRYRWEGGGLFGGRSIRLESLSR